MKLNEHKYLADPSFRLNADDAPFSLGTNEIVNGENIRTSTTDNGVTNVVTSIGSNVLISTPQPSVVFITIGTAADSENGRIFKFQYNTTGVEHKIVCLYVSTQTEVDVLLSSQVTGGLNFSKDHPIHSARFTNGLLTWTDNNEEPKSIIVNAAINLNNAGSYPNDFTYTSPLKYESTTLIRRPPIFPLIATKETDPSYHNNFTQNNWYLFTFAYTFENNQNSALASYSNLIFPNFTGETYNSILITVPFSEYIDDDILQVNVYAKYGNSGDTLLIKSWTKTNDASAISDHNAGITALSFTFYDDVAGSALDSVSASTPFHDVPLLSETFEQARNRNFLANNLYGYNTPSTTSLAATLSTYDTGGGSYAGSLWKYMTLQYYDPAYPSIFYYKNIYYAYNSSISPSTAYYYSAYQGTYPSSLNTTDADSSWNTESALAYYIIRNNIGLAAGLIYNDGSHAGYVPPAYYDTGNTLTLIVPAGATALNFLKSNSTYKISIAFYDRFRHKCGIIEKSTVISGVTYNPLSVSVPIRTYSQTTFNSLIEWTLSNADALNEIPDWAYYYQIHITKNLTTRFFLQIYSPKSSYVTRTLSSGTYTYTYNQTAWEVNTNYATSFDISQLYANGLGYVFNEGDMLVCYRSDGTNFIQPILMQDGDNILVSPFDLGDLTGTVATLVEIYTPYKQGTTEPYYETGSVYPILNPATVSREYSTLSGTINGDCYAIERNATNIASPSYYFVEAMSPDDLVWSVWNTDTGWINFIDLIGQQRKETNIAYSDTFILGSKTDNSNIFEPLNQQDLDATVGGLQKLQLTSKVQYQGTIMLAIGKFQTSSVYLGEVQVVDSTGASQFLGTSNNVIGTINTLKGSFGTINPESVVEFRGDVFWADAINGRWIQYSINGLDPINYKTERMWNLWFKKYISLTAAEIEAFGSRPFIFTVVDPYHLELLVSLPKLSNEPPKGYLPDYPSTIFPFDILDYQAKTVTYKLGMAQRPPHWQSAFTFYSENFISLQNKLYSFKNGLTYLHNDLNSQNNFYGVQYTSKVMVVSNAEGEIVKSYNNIGVQSNICPLFVYMYNDYPQQQSSDLVDYNFRDMEGIWNAVIYRNKLIPTFDGYNTDGLLTGQKMRNTSMFIMFEFNVSATPLALRLITIGFDISKGNNNQILK